MPRKNRNHKRRGNGPGRRRPGAGSSPIDWERIEAKAGERDPDETPSQSERSRQKIRNEFARWLTSFSSETIELILKYGFEGMDERGVLPVRFTGISQKPTKKLDYVKPSSVISRDGFVVISGMVSPSDVKEISRSGGESNVEQILPPNLDGYDSSRRLNITLGRQPSGFDNEELSGRLSEGGDLLLSQVVEINGQEIGPNANAIRMEELWERPEIGNPWRLGAW